MALKTASRTTAEVCRKFGEKILGEIVPILRSKLSSTDSRTREGVCLTICEVMYAFFSRISPFSDHSLHTAGKTPQSPNARAMKMSLSVWSVCLWWMMRATCVLLQQKLSMFCRTTWALKRSIKQSLHCLKPFDSQVRAQVQPCKH